MTETCGSTKGAASGDDAAGAPWLSLGSLASLLALGLTACSGQPSLERWKSVQGVPPYEPPVLFVASAPPPAGAASVSAPVSTIAANQIDITIDGKKAAAEAKPLKVGATGKPAPSGEDASKAKAEDPPAPVDLTKVKRILMAGVERDTLRPGDRLLLERIKIRLDDDRYAFTDYELAATDRQKVDIGSVSVTDTRSGSLSATGGPPQGGSVTGALSAERVRQGSRAISGQAEFSVSVSAHEVDIYRTGVEGQDLTGNTLIKLAIRLPPVQQIDVSLGRPKLRGDDGTILEPAKARIDIARLTLDPPRPILATGTLHYEDRDIAGGEGDLDEGRQSALIRTGVCERKFVLVPASDLAPLLWAVVDAAGAALQFNDGLLSRPLVFDDERAADTLLSWARTKHTTGLANGRLEASNGVVPSDLGALRVVRYQLSEAAAADAAMSVASRQLCPPPPETEPKPAA